MDKIKLGFAPTRRNLFSADAAIEYAKPNFKFKLASL